MAQLYKIRKSSTAPATLPDRFLNFGPLYRREHDFRVQMKNEAWEHVLPANPADRRSAENSYFQAVGGIDDIQEDYDSEMHGREDPRVFLETIIKDGCFFLQLVILILEGPVLLNYGDHTLIFGRGGVDNERWIRSMLFSGNQISYKVLHKLMKQDFFKNIISSMKLERPSSLFKMALYELLLFGFLIVDRERTWDEVRRRRSLRGVLQRLRERQKPFDLIHHLQLLIIGEQMQAAEGGNDGHFVDVAEDFRIRNVWYLREIQGIRFEKEDNIGSGGIHFGRKWYFFQYLHLPKFTADEYTEQILRCLVGYENVHHKNEVISYVKLMSAFVTEASDVKILRDEGILDAAIVPGRRLPGILRRVIDDLEAEVAHIEAELAAIVADVLAAIRNAVAAALLAEMMAVAAEAIAEASAAIIRITVPCPNILKVRRQIRKYYRPRDLSEPSTLMVVAILIVTINQLIFSIFIYFRLFGCL